MQNKQSILILVFVGLIVYINSLLNGFVGDDFSQIISNPRVQSVQNIPSFFAGSTYASSGENRMNGLYYRPLMLTVYSIIYSSFGPDPLFFHLVQILIHIANSIFLFLFLKNIVSTTQKKTAETNNILPFLVSIFFLIHPINDEAVVYIANLQDILFFFFGIAALLLIQKQHKHWGHYVLLFFCFLLSLLSKETGIVFLLMGVIYSFMFEKKLLKTVSLIAISAIGIYLILRFPIAKMYLAQKAATPIANASFPIRLMNIPIIIFYYLRLFFFPVVISQNQHWIITKISVLDFWMPIVFIVFTFIAIFKGYKRVPTQTKHLFLFFLMWLVGGALLHLQIIPLDVTVTERWMYFSVVGAFVLCALVIQTFPSIFQEKFRKLTYGLITLILVMLASRSFVRNFDWHNNLTLYSHDIQFTRKNYLLDNAYGSELINIGKVKEAKPYIQSSVSEYPYYANLVNLGIIYVDAKNYSEAKKYLKQAVDTSTNNSVYENYANFLLYYDDINEAKTFSEASLKTFPQSQRLLVTISKAEYVVGDHDTAIKHLQRAIELRPDTELQKLLTKMKNDEEIDIVTKKEVNP